MKYNNKEQWRLESILDSIGLGTWEWYIDKKETLYNTKYGQMIGYTLEEMDSSIYNAGKNSVHPDDQKSIEKSLAQCFDRKTPIYDLEFRMKHKNGSWIWVHARGKVVSWSEDNQPLIMYGTHEEITSQKKLVKELDDVQTLLKASIESSKDIIILAIDKDFRYLYFNETHTKVMVYAYNKHIEIGMSLLDCITSETDRQKSYDNYSLALRGEAHKTIEVYGDVNKSYYETFYNPIRNENGEVIGATAYARNITEKKLAEEALLEAEWKFKALFEKSPIGVAYHAMIYDDKGEASDYFFIDANNAYKELTGVNPIGKTVKQAFPGIENDPMDWIGTFGEVAKTGKEIQFEQYLELNNNWYKCVAYQYKPDHFVVAFTNITMSKLSQRALAEEKERLAVTLRSIGDGVITTDDNGNVTIMNKIAEELTGWKQIEAIGKPIGEVFNYKTYDESIQKQNESKVDRRSLSERKDNFTTQTILTMKDGKEILVEKSSSPILNENSQDIGRVIVFRDYTEKWKRIKKIEYLSFHDELTGLYNRRFFEEEMKRIDTKNKLPISLIMGDVNGLKLINDSFGHEKGDELLLKAAHVIKQGCRDDDAIARIGGDEFVVILPNSNNEKAMEVVDRIQSMTINEDVMGINISISFGVGTKTDINQNLRDIFKEAEDYLYKHKLYESSSMRNKTLKLISNTLYAKNVRELIHSEKVSELCERLSSKMDFSNEAIKMIKLAGLMHDIGKIGIADEILNKPGRLNDDEYMEIKKHSEIGYRILSSVNEFSEISEFVLQHHENWDGTGYPQSMKGEEIKIEARIIGLVDAYSAMINERTYGKIKSKDEAIREIKRCSGSQFDPTLAKIFVEGVLGEYW